MKTGLKVLAVAAAIAFSGVALADKAKFEGACADCHEASEFAGKPAAELTKSIKDHMGKGKHKKLTLTDAEAASLAAYLSTAK
ncbi:MAG: hypothetical protein O9284_03810 [Steroidobacteraceae bacterium]|jgi:mono/diheme cytochrome c family protein|nr:hypothetical protein [Steroidobacteraceae bacterium]